MFLKNKSHYEDLYDKFTVDECRRMEKYFEKVKFPEYKGKRVLEVEQESLRKSFCELSLYFVKGGRYAKKEEWIVKMMDKDRERDEMLENAIEPENVRCSCGAKMELTMRELMLGLEVDRVLFLYRCLSCRKGRAIYEGGEEYISKNDFCSVCGGKNDSTDTRNDDVITIRRKCRSCGYEEVDTLDLTIKSNMKEVDEDLDIDKKRFCISDKVGFEYLDYRRRMDEFKEYEEKEKIKSEQKEVYDQLKGLRKLTIMDLENLLLKPLEESGYVRLDLLSPEFGKEVVVPFTVRDEKSDRIEYDSRQGLKKIIDKLLFDTNWRLMSEGIDYRMGFLSGKLKGIENEDDLVELIKKGKKGVNQIKK